MSFLSKFFGSSHGPSKGTQEAPKFPLTVDVVPGHLAVSVVSHPIDNVPGSFWSLVSSGLKAQNQREIVFTLLRREDETEAAPPQDLFAFYAQVYEFARRGQLVGPGGWTDFGRSGFLGSHFRGVAYAAAQRISGVVLPSDALAGVLLTSSEMDVARRCGIYRVLSRLGQSRRYFPFPYWGDRDREETATEGADTLSILGRVGAQIRTKGISLLAEGRHLKMRVLPAALTELKQALEQAGADGAIAFIAEPAAEADGWLVWLPGQRDFAAITPPGSNGSCLTGFHLTIAPGVAKDRVTILEDGFAMTLRSESWRQFRQALQSEGTFSLPTTGESMGFHLVWIPPPSGPTSKADESLIRLHLVQFLIPDAEMGRRIRAQPLATYVQQLVTAGERVSRELWSPVATPTAMTVSVAVKPGGDRHVWVTFEAFAELSPEKRSRFEVELHDVPPPSPTGLIVFQILAQLWGGPQKDGASFPKAPGEWDHVVERQGSMDVESLVEKIWAESSSGRGGGVPKEDLE